MTHEERIVRDILRVAGVVGLVCLAVLMLAFVAGIGWRMGEP